MTNQELVFEKLFPTSAGSEKMNSELRQSYERIKENRKKILRQLPPSYDGKKPLQDDELNKLAELGEFMADYSKAWGTDVCIYHLQTGLNILTEYRKESVIPELVRIEENGELNAETVQKLRYVMSKFPIRAIKSAIVEAGENNYLWATKNNTQLDTDKIIKNIANQFNERRK